MKNRTQLRSLVIALLLGAILVAPTISTASDHADPITLTNLGAGITGLFVYEKQDQLVLTLTIRRSLTAPAPYDVEDHVYSIYLDLDHPVTFGDPENLKRYGGTVNDPLSIEHDAAIRFRLNGDGASFQADHPKLEGALSSASVTHDVGVYDDPFIFPRFFGTNVIAMSVAFDPASIGAPNHMLVWGTTETTSGRLIDHVGRANRTQLGRFDFLNKLHPSEHVTVIEERLEGGPLTLLQNTLARAMNWFLPFGSLSGLVEYVLQLRPYDVHPDVVIYNRSRAEQGHSFPNGRRLEDDVAGLTCKMGDCVLQEVAFIEGHWPRQRVNDKDFTETFPYLAPPWPLHEEHSHNNWAGVIIVLLIALLLYWLIRRIQRKIADRKIQVRPYLTNKKV